MYCDVRTYLVYCFEFCPSPSIRMNIFYLSLIPSFGDLDSCSVHTRHGIVFIMMGGPHLLFHFIS